jgi:geranylgeranyl diphosphate synthase type II
MTFATTPDRSVPAHFAALRSTLERRLSMLVPPGSASRSGVAEAMHAAVMTPGKRLRPLLMLVVGEALGGRGPGLLDLACAVEMVHCASLVLDDMPAMDDARLRRGEPTVHLRFGEDVAMLAAVALVSEACRVAASAPGLRPAVRARAVEVLCRAIGPAGLSHGQYLDLREPARTPAAAAEVNDHKTGLLFATAMEIAARAAGASSAVPPLRRAALAIGQAFQLQDDLDDLGAPTATQEPRGEEPGQDSGKHTLLAIAGPVAVQQALDARLAEAARELRAVFGAGDAPWLHLLQRAFPSRPLAVPQAAESAPDVTCAVLPRRQGTPVGAVA